MLGCEYLYALGPFRDDTGDWMREHLNVDPRDASCGNCTSSGAAAQAVFEVFEYRAPEQRRTPPANSDVGGHHVALYVDDLDAAVAHLKKRGVTVLGEPTVSRGPERGATMGLLPRPVGNAVRTGVLPWRQSVRPPTPQRTPSHARRPRRLLAEQPGPRSDPASQRVADHLRTQILSGAIQPGERIRQEDVAEMFALSRLPVREALRMLAAEGLTEMHPNKGARVPKLSMREVDVVYRMRESLEPLALSESMPTPERYRCRADA